MKKIIFIFACLFSIIPFVNGVSYHSYGVTEKEQELILEEESSENKEFIDFLEYHLTEKDYKDSTDYMILFVLIMLILVIIVLSNKKTYIIYKEEDVFQIEPNGLY